MSRQKGRCPTCTHSVQPIYIRREKKFTPLLEDYSKKDDNNPYWRPKRAHYCHHCDKIVYI